MKKFTTLAIAAVLLVGCGGDTGSPDTVLPLDRADEENVVDPPAQQPYVVSVYCDMSGINAAYWGGTLYNIWSDGRRTVAGSC